MNWFTTPELVVLGLGKVDQPDPLAACVAVLLKADRHAFGQQPMKGLVAGQQFGCAGAQRVLQRRVHHRGGQPVVDAPGGLGQAAGQQHLGVVAALGLVAIGRDSGAGAVGVALALEKLDGEGFDGGFGERAGYQ